MGRTRMEDRISQRSCPCGAMRMMAKMAEIKGGGALDGVHAAANVLTSWS